MQHVHQRILKCCCRNEVRNIASQICLCVCIVLIQILNVPLSHEAAVSVQEPVATLALNDNNTQHGSWWHPLLHSIYPCGLPSIAIVIWHSHHTFNKQRNQPIAANLENMNCKEMPVRWQGLACPANSTYYVGQKTNMNFQNPRRPVGDNLLR